MQHHNRQKSCTFPRDKEVRKIYTFTIPRESFDELNPDKQAIRQLISKHISMVDRLKKNMSYYEGKHKILDETKRENRLVCNHAKDISDTASSYFIGNPVTYKSEGDIKPLTDKAGMIGESYVPGATGTSALRKFKEGIKAVRDSYNGALICQATPEFIMELELELAGKIENTTFSKGGIDTRVPAVDRVPLIPTSSNRMYTAIKINDGKTVGQEKGGYEKGTSAKNLNFFICPVTTPIAVTKQDIMRIFDPTTNQRLNAWQMDYRRFHDMWILDNKLDSIYLSIQEAKA